MTDQETLAAFQTAWPIGRVRDMSLEEYAFGGGTDTFCYWIEHETYPLGSISGVWANKFGIYRQKENAAPSKSTDFMDGEGYRWRSKYGSTAQEAFETVKRLVLQVMDAAQRDDLYTIGRTKELHQTFKWKLASLYAPDRVFPIFNIELLHRIAHGHHMPNAAKAKMTLMHRYMVDQVPKGQSIYDFARLCYRRYRNEEGRRRGYYVIGTRYDEAKGRVNVYPKMRAEGVAAVGYLADHDIGELFHSTLADARSFVKDALAEYSERRWDVGAKRAIPRFTRIHPGDIIAFKGKSINRKSMSVVGYAMVTDEDGDCYNGVIDGLGQTIRVEHFEPIAEREVLVKMADTVREFHEGTEEWKHIFAPYSGLVAETTKHQEERKRGGRKAAGQLNRGSVPRAGSPGGTMDFYHRRMQERLMAWLRSEYPNDTIEEEVDWMDVYRKGRGYYHIYEVKTGPTAFDCIRSAVGQLLDYAQRREGTKGLQLWVVGEQPMNERARVFLRYVNAMFNQGIEYMRFDMKASKPFPHEER